MLLLLVFQICGREGTHAGPTASSPPQYIFNATFRYSPSRTLSASLRPPCRTLNLLATMVLAPGYTFPAASHMRKVVKATILIKKKPGLPDADFVTHYNTVHAQLAAPILLKHNIISYTLTYQLERDRTIMQDIMKGKANLLDYDAICTFVFPDWMSFARFMYDKEGAALRGDHENFMVESEMKTMIGDEFVVIEGGKKVERSMSF